MHIILSLESCGLRFLGTWHVLEQSEVEVSQVSAIIYCWICSICLLGLLWDIGSLSYMKNIQGETLAFRAENGYLLENFHGSMIWFSI